MVTIDWVSVGIGAGAVIVLVFLFNILKTFKKPKVDLHNLKKLVYENAIKTKEVYESFRDLEAIFKEMEK